MGVFYPYFITRHASAEHSDIVQLPYFFYVTIARLLRLCITVFFFSIIFDWILYFLTRKVTALGFDPRIVTLRG